MFGWLKHLLGLPRRNAHRALRARYDLSRTTNQNKRDWAGTDSLSAVGALTSAVRKTIRERSRQEQANNSYCKGLVLTCANDLIGTGPKLQVLTESKEANRRIETLFAEWAVGINLAEKLRTMKQAKTGDGESFALLTTNMGVPTSVKLDLWPFDCDYVESPWVGGFDPKIVDGIRFDEAGNPVAYYVANEHPGDNYRFDAGGKWVPARSIIHLFRADRPGQVRGVSEITPALPLFAQLRRLTLALLATYETAADISGVLSTDQVPETGDPALVKDWDTQEISRRMLVSLPPGYKLEQFKAEQPTSVYSLFKRELILEIARCLNMPYAIAAGDSSDSSYASGRLEFQSWDIALRVERDYWELRALDRIFNAWLDEAVNIEGYLPQGVVIADLPHVFFWDNRPHVDPSKESKALETLLANNGTTLAKWYAGRGEDWEDALRQRAKEKALEKELGLEIVKPGVGENLTPEEIAEQDATRTN